MNAIDTKITALFDKQAASCARHARLMGYLGTLFGFAAGNAMWLAIARWSGWL
ncbi:hypothetical protein [Consotaella aegiceratis]|uniref:hypothetical protein n=1 Tax=Consotaella aegiceratis TaxID=3097961 RepID=UPI002F412617